MKSLDGNVFLDGNVAPLKKPSTKIEAKAIPFATRSPRLMPWVERRHLTKGLALRACQQGEAMPYDS